MPMQIKRRLGSPGSPTTLADGQLAFSDPGTPAYDGLPIASDTELYVGSEDSVPDPVVRTLVSRNRQVELAGTQTITGAKTIAIANLKITGATAANMIVTATNTTGDIHWTAAPSGGLLTVAVNANGTLAGDGTAGDPLGVIKLPTPRDFTVQAAAAAGDGSRTVIAITPASFDGTANATMTGFAIQTLDDGTY